MFSNKMLSWMLLKCLTFLNRQTKKDQAIWRLNNRNSTMMLLTRMWTWRSKLSSTARSGMKHLKLERSSTGSPSLPSIASHGLSMLTERQSYSEFNLSKKDTTISVNHFSRIWEILVLLIQSSTPLTLFWKLRESRFSRIVWMPLWRVVWLSNSSRSHLKSSSIMSQLLMKEVLRRSTSN